MRFSGKAFALVLAVGLAATGLWAAGEEEQPAAAADKKYVTDPVTGKVYSAPEYGGTLIYVFRSTVEPRDPWFGSGAGQIMSAPLEKLGTVDWAIDRDMFHFVGGYAPPLSALTGALAESWEQPDATTYIFHIRQGVHWHDKPPMNGRELTAEDVEFNFHRMLGNKLTGTGFSEAEPSPAAGALGTLPWESVTATDDGTVVMKLTEPRLRAEQHMLDQRYVFIQPPEVIEQHGDMQDWRNIVGTGPFMLTDFVPDSSLTFTKNPNYWGFDEKYPDNRLPYVDELKALYMEEYATIMAALRSGQADCACWQGNSQIATVDQAESLMRTNPELVVIPFFQRANHGTKINTAKPPFDDIRVRRAMQMALDLETINATYFKGFADTTPMGLVNRDFCATGYCVPFEDWPEEIKQYYRYDPEGAEKLLDEAGLPRGTDGTRFETTYLTISSHDVSWPELLGGYWGAVGIKLNIQPIPIGELIPRLTAARPVRAAGGIGDWDMWVGSTGAKGEPWQQMSMSYGGSTGWHQIPQHDAQYDALYDEMVGAATVAEQTRPIREMDMRHLEQHWMIWGPEAPQFAVHQPWLMGYGGEGAFGSQQYLNVWARLWVDSQLKAEMSR
ncbi:MAG: ABC transporter substrate-binding protein [Spirochaetaceae bacterium]|nr:ABC transporter substrate-binding protein [Spirochaetaceae bacterium]